MAELELLDEFFAKLAEKKDFVVGKDIETTPLKDHFFRRARTLQFGNPHQQFVIDLLKLCGNDPETLFNVQGNYGARLNDNLQALMTRLAPVTESKQWLKVGVNLSFEYMTFYWNFGRRTYNFYDCTMAEKCIWAGAHSLKDYSFYSMNEMMERYFHLTVDKTLQESFTLDAELSQDQINYAALDTRVPFGIKHLQGVIASGIKLSKLKETNSPMVKYLEHLEPKTPGTEEPVVMGDKLYEIIQIENDAIGAFEDMHIHGERLDKERWLARIAKKKTRLIELIATELDPYFIPLVGDKRKANSDAEIAEAEAKWKGYNTISPAELAVKSQMYKVKKTDPIAYAALEVERANLESARKIEKEHHKKIAGDMKKNRTKVKNLAAKCEGNALINYSSDAQLMAILKEVKGLGSLKSMDDEALEKFEKYPVMVAIRELHGLQKEIGTYGDSWAMEWATKPCKEEGWLHPGDGRLHCVFNQYDAETGRSSSEKPNGQNLPQDKEVRSCFIADAPNEKIRVSLCCEADATLLPNGGTEAGVCSACGELCATHAEEYVIVTADMSGAELRIIAELANDPIWVGAFNRGEDVHSVGTEILHEDNWTSKTVRLPGKETWTVEQSKNKDGQHTVLTITDDDGKVTKIGPCMYYALKENGEPSRQKCKCPEHNELRNDNKSTNFLLAYGGGPSTLAKRIKKALEKASELMQLHSQKFPKIWKYLDESGKRARMLKKSFDMFGRRRIFPEPTWERAKEKFKTDKVTSKLLKLDEKEYGPKLVLFETFHKRKPTEDELYELTHRQPTQKEINKTMGGMSGGIERQGKNHAIQGTNATIAKKAMGCGYDKEGNPYLWHTLPTFRAWLLKFVHDELVAQCPKHKAKAVADLIGDAFRRAAAEKMKLVVMEFEYNIAFYWMK